MSDYHHKSSKFFTSYSALGPIQYRRALGHLSTVRRQEYFPKICSNQFVFVNQIWVWTYRINFSPKKAQFSEPNQIIFARKTKFEFFGWAAHWARVFRFIFTGFRFRQVKVYRTEHILKFPRYQYNQYSMAPCRNTSFVYFGRGQFFG